MGIILASQFWNVSSYFSVQENEWEKVSTHWASILKENISDGMEDFAPVIISGSKIGYTNNCSYKQLIVAAVSHLWMQLAAWP